MEFTYGFSNFHLSERFVKSLLAMDGRRLNPKRKNAKRRSTTMDSQQFQNISISVSPNPNRRRKPSLKNQRSKTPVTKKRKKGKHHPANSDIVASLNMDACEPDMSRSKSLKKVRSTTPGVSMDMDRDDSIDYAIEEASKSKAKKSTKSAKHKRPKSARGGPKNGRNNISIPSSGTTLASHDSDSRNIRRGHVKRPQSARIVLKEKSHSQHAQHVNHISMGTMANMGNIRKMSKSSPMTKSMKLSNSKSITNASKLLKESARSAKRQIGDAFNSYHDALDEQQDKLMDDLELLHEDKKEELGDAERNLFNNRSNGSSRKVRSKKSDPKDIEFDAALNVIIDVDAAVSLIKSRRFGYVDNGDGYLENEGIGNGASSGSLDIGMDPGDISVLAPLDEDTKEQWNDEIVLIEEVDENPGREAWDDGEQTPAMLQKQVLGDIQQRTMSVVDTVIEMERLAKRKKWQAEQLKQEVEAKLKYIDTRSKEINDKLEAARPELEKAREAVESIKPRDLNEIKALKQPPAVIANVMTATVMILGMFSMTFIVAFVLRNRLRNDSE